VVAALGGGGGRGAESILRHSPVSFGDNESERVKICGCDYLFMYPSLMRDAFLFCSLIRRQRERERERKKEKETTNLLVEINLRLKFG
jgi:hypothetical protein